jgi:hypothetical protein
MTLYLFKKRIFGICQAYSYAEKWPLAHCCEDKKNLEKIIETFYKEIYLCHTDNSNNNIISNTFDD